MTVIPNRERDFARRARRTRSSVPVEKMFMPEEVFQTSSL